MACRTWLAADNLVYDDSAEMGAPETLQQAVISYVRQNTKGALDTLWAGFEATMKSVHTWLIILIGTVNVFLCNVSGGHPAGSGIR